MKMKCDQHKVAAATDAILNVFSKMKLDQSEGLSAISMILMTSLMDSNATKDQALQMLGKVWDRTEAEFNRINSKLH